MISHEVEPCGCRIGVRARPDSTWAEGNLQLTILYCGAHYRGLDGHKLEDTRADLRAAKAELSKLRAIVKSIQTDVSRVRLL